MSHYGKWSADKPRRVITACGERDAVCFGVCRQRIHQHSGDALIAEIGRDFGMVYVPASVVFGITDVACFQTVDVDLEAAAFGVMDHFGHGVLSVFEAV